MLTPWKEIYNQPRQLIKKKRHYFANKRLSSQGYGFSSGHVWMWELDYKENWALKNLCFWFVVLEKTLESPLASKDIQPVHPKEISPGCWCWRTDVEAETPVLWPPDAVSFEKTWCWERLWAGGEWDDRGWDGWMASLTQWTWVWVDSGSWWWTGRPGMLWFMGSQRVGHNWATELNWTYTITLCNILKGNPCKKKNKESCARRIMADGDASHPSRKDLLNNYCVSDTILILVMTTFSFK